MDLLPIQEHIWKSKYQFSSDGGISGAPSDQTIEDTWWRVAWALAKAEGPDERIWAKRFYAAMEGFKFIPAGRVLAGGGTGRAVTLFNCFVLNSVPDSMEGIFQTLKEGALTLQQGGGIGTDFSTLRPKGALVKGVGADASGPVSFMDCWDSMCRTIMSAGARRGAMMGTLRCLSGDSMVHTLEGRIPIKELVGKRPYVFACDPSEKRVHIVQADKVFVSDKNRQMIRVHLDNYTYIDCTPDHLFMLSSGDFREAGKLTVGASLMAIEHTIGKHGSNRYVRAIKCTKGKRELEHRVVAQDVLGHETSYDWHVHHSDENALYNDPGNLEILSRSDHAKRHNSNLNVLRLKIAAERKGKRRADVYGSEKSEEWARKQRETIAAKKDNHKVVRIEQIGIAEKVFDISLPKWHNFAVNEVFVHNCDHPDIEMFIEAKRDPAKLRMFNISVLVTDAFMDAVKNGSNWDLQFGGKIYKTISARGLWEQIMRGAYEYSEPGVIFIDRINKTNNLNYCETISATNPCAEQPLPPNGACLLGSINLAAFVRNPFKPDCFMDKAVLEETVHVAVRMLDNVIDVSNYPLESQEREAKSKRRLGLGVTGLADALVMCGLHYGSKIARNTAAFWQRMITEAAYQESIRLADEKGAFPLYDAERAPIPDCLTYTTGVAEGFETCRRRNSHLISIAPTGTISLLAGNVSSGVEPIYEWNFTRKILEPDGTHRFEEVEDYAVRLYREAHPAPAMHAASLPDEFRARHHELTPKEHLLMQAVLQPFVDSSISKTVNCPEDMTFEAFESLYLDAYKLGLKCCAAFRPNAITGSVLSATPAKKPEPKVISEFKASHVSLNEDGSVSLAGAATFKDEGGIKESFKKLQDALHPGTPENPPLKAMPVDIKVNIATNTDAAPDGRPPMAGELTSGDVFVIKPTATNTGESYSAAPPPREAALDGKTYKLRWPPSPHAIYITINDDEDGNAYEIFINSKNLEHYAWTVALTRMVSAIFRRGGDISFVAEELKAVFDPKGGAWMDGKYVPSLLAAIGNVIEKHIDSGAHAPCATDEGATNPEAIKAWMAWMERNPMPPAPEDYASKFDIGSGITATSKHAGVVPGNWPATCPKCFSSNVRFPKPGCTQCLDCGYSNCE